jgi:hypothetical protein
LGTAERDEGGLGRGLGRVVETTAVLLLVVEIVGVAVVVPCSRDELLWLEAPHPGAIIAPATNSRMRREVEPDTS